jgi:hypothetical protein
METPFLIYRPTCVKSLSKEGTSDLGPCINVKYSIQLLKLYSFMEIFNFIAEMPMKLSI